MPTTLTGRCYYCKRQPDQMLNARGTSTVELRPYGPDGADVCFECAMTPERVEETKIAFKGRLAIAEAASPLHIAAIQEGAPPVPFRTDDGEDA